MSRRLEILQEINSYIEEEYGSIVTEEDMIVDAELDSLGLTLVFLAIDNKYKVYPKEEFESLDLTKVSVKEILDKVELCL